MKTFGFQWHLTDRCNLSCAHCYQGRFDGAAELPAGELEAMARRIFVGAADRPISVNLTGGEPLIFEHLVLVLELLHGFPNLEDVSIITNGTVSSTGLLERLASFPKLDCIKISLESANPDVNDRIRGRGHTARVVKNLELYKKIVKRPIVLMMTLARYNVDEIPGLVYFAQEHELSGVIFERFVPLGQGLGVRDEVMTADDWQRAVESILERAEVDADPGDLLAMRAFWLGTGPENKGELSGALCNLGDESMALMPDGTVYPCRRLPIEVGNLRRDPFDAVLEKLDEFSFPKIAPKLKGLLCGACGVEGCRGCRASTLALTGDLYGDDPQCPLVASL